MIKEIKYTGITTRPSDMECADGELAAAVNVANKDGSLYAIPAPTVLFTLDAGYQLLYIHNGSSFTNYVVLSPDCKLKALNNTQEYLDFALDTGNFGGIINIQSIGNTLVLLCENGIHYILYKDNDYKYLGQKPPQMNITFDLYGRLARSAKWDVTAPEDINTTDLQHLLSEKNQSELTADILAKVNKFIQEKGFDKGRFIFPFFVRYAYRMYDGSYIMQSAPVLMLPSSYIAPSVPIYEVDGRTFSLRVCAISSKLQIRSIACDWPSLSKWKDIITGVDVFISAPIYNYNQNGAIKSLESFTGPGRYTPANFGIFGLQSYQNGLFDKHYFSQAYEAAKTFDSYSPQDEPDPEEDLPDKSGFTPEIQFSLPSVSFDDLKDNIRNCSLFYKLCSMKFQDDSNYLEDFNVNADTLNTLELQSRLEDDYYSHDTLKAKYAYTYNARLNLANLSRTLFDGFPAQTICEYTQPTDGNEYIYDIYTYIREVDKNIIIKRVSSVNMGLFGAYLYYPNPKAYKMVIVRHTNPDIPTPPDPGEITTFDIQANAMVSSIGEGEEQKMYWTISLNTIPDGIISNTGLSIDGYIEFSPPIGGGHFEGHIEKGSEIVRINTGFPYIEGVDTMSFANLNVVADNPYYKAGKVSFNYPSAINVLSLSDSKVAPRTEYTTVELTPHAGLNGAYYFGAFAELKWTSGDPGITASEDKETVMPNKLYTSEVENPFIFPVTSINTIGAGEILGICSATKALSEGQFGQFPLYAFTSEGIWALEITQSGSFMAKQPVTRDVCNNPHSITQTDGAVAFTTEQGIMLLSGSESLCISDMLAGEISPKNIIQYHDFFRAAGIPLLDFDYLPFQDYIKDCRIAYDYPNSRIIVFNPSADQKYAYVFSVKTRTWTTIEHNYIDTLNNYPDSYITTSDNTVTIIAEVNRSFSGVKGVIVSRPMKLDFPDVLKTVDTLIHRGIFAWDRVKSMIFASRDNINFFPLASSTNAEIRRIHGTPYKYFIFAISIDFDSGHSLPGSSVSYTNKYTDKLR